jgi:ApeA N-terminal domain 1/Apea-like HEPN
VRDRTLEGHWWLLGREDDKIAGILTYDGEARLRLLGAFRNRSEVSSGVASLKAVEEAPMILGACEGTVVTLIECQQRHFSAKFGATEDWRQIFNARLMLVGVWLDEPAEEYFDRIVVGIDQLLPWSKQSGLEQHLEQVDGRWNSFGFNWEPVEALEAQVGDASVQLRLGCSIKQNVYGDRAAGTLTEQADFTVTVPKPRSADSLITQWTKPLQDLLTLAMGTPCGLHQVTLIRTNPPQPEPPDVGAPQAYPVKVDVYLAPLYRARPDDKAVADHDALFTLQDLSLGELVPAWFEVCERLGPVIGMLLGQRYMGRAFVENRLITAVAAAEGLHRRLLSGMTYTSDGDFDAIKAALIEAVEGKHHRWLMDRLWNEPSLKERLMQLVDHVGVDVVEPIIPKPNRWAADAKNARNILVHRFDVGDSNETPNGAVMYALAELTSSVIVLTVLQELGFSKEKLRRLAATHEAFRWVREHAKKHLPRIFDATRG